MAMTNISMISIRQIAAQQMVTKLTCWFAQAASRKAMSSSRPKTPLPVIGNLASDTFFGPNLAFGLRVTARESAAGIFCKLLLLIVCPVSKFKASG